jgi:hypothetical protein
MVRIYALVAAWAGVLAPSAMAADAPSSISEAVFHAVTLCERAVQTEGAVRFDRPKGAELYEDLLGRAGKPDIARMQSTAPALIQRFVSTLPWRAMEAPAMMMRYPAASGEAWAVIGQRTGSCNVMVTGSVDPVAATLVDQMAERGWRVVVARPAVKPATFAQHVLVKMNPTPSAPNWGVRALVRSVGFTPEARDGVEMEMSFVAGDIVVKAPVVAKP